MILNKLGQALCLALLAPALAAGGSLPPGPLGVLREQAKLTGVGDPVGDRNEFFGSAVAAEGDTVVVGAPGSSDTGAAYVFVRSSGEWTLEARLSVPGVERLGNAVALSGDTAVVGNPDSSLVHVFVRNAGVWSLQATLAGSDTTFNDGFGASLSLSGDTAVVGAPNHTTGFGNQSGAAYVFVRSGSTWTEQQRLVSDTLAAQDYLGTSVSVSGDSLVVGAPGDDTGVGLDAGSTYVFSRSGTVWAQEARLFLLAGSNGGAFGTSVSLDGATLLVGTPGESEAGVPSSGAAYVFVRSGASWSLEQRLVTAPITSSFSFGMAVALQADTAIVGSPGDNATFFGAGAVHVFVRSGGVWSEQQKLTAAVPEMQADLGRAVSVSGDAVLAGAPGRDRNSGSAFVFRRMGSTWDDEARLDPPGTARSDAFGSAVALEDDVLVVGAPRDDVPGGRGAGSAYVFVRTAGVWALQQKIVAGDPGEDAQFGAAVSLSGDTLAIGAPEMGDGDSGAVYVFVRIGGLWELQQKLEHPDGTPYSRFGHAVSLDGDSLLVGTPHDDGAGAFRAGAAHVFVRSGSSWSWQQSLFEAAPSDFAQAGFAVAIRGARALVGASGDGAAGRVSVFERAASVWTQAASLSATDGTPGDNFGAAVGLSGDTAIVGAPDSEGPPGFRSGAAYVFVRDGGGSWSQQQRLAEGGPQIPSDLGAAVAVSGDSALVAPAGSFLPSAALLFTRQSGVWTLKQRIAASDGTPFDEYGIAVALSGLTAAVGAPRADTPVGFDSGATYVLVPAVTDLAVSIGGTPASVVQGDLVTYTIVVSNNGSEVAPAVGLVDSLDPGLVVESASASQGSCTLVSSGASCDLGAVPAGGTATVTVVAAGALVGAQTSLASIQWGGSDPVPGNDASSVSTTVSPGAPADVAVTALSATPLAQVGTNVVYQVRVENVGPGKAAGVAVNDPTPPGLVLDQVLGGCDSLPCVIPRMLAGEQQDLVVFFQVPPSYPGPDPIVNTATVSSLTDDPVASNNSSSASTPFFLPAGNLDYHTLTPCRFFDTRDPAAGGPLPLEAGNVRVVSPSFDDCVVPFTAQAIAVNVTVTEPTATGNLRLYPAGSPVPPVSTLNYGVGQTRGNNAVVSLSNHAFSIRVAQPSGTVHVIVDVFGYFE